MWLALAIVTCCRALDLLSTWLVSPTLAHECNPLIRRLGWRLTLVLNVAVCLLAAHYQGSFFHALCVLSCVAATWNLWLYWRWGRRV